MNPKSLDLVWRSFEEKADAQRKKRPAPVPAVVFHGAHDLYTPRTIVKEILDNLDLPNKSILVLFNIEFVLGLIGDFGVEASNITLYSDHPTKTRYATIMGVNIVTELEPSMKFDVILGNPPFHDGNQDGGQNKIYNQFSKMSLNLMSNQGVLAFITPRSVLKKSKRFSLIGLDGLKVVNLNASEHFNVGVDICWWMVDKQYTGDVTVIDNNETRYQSKNKVIYKTDDQDFVKLYEALKEATATPELRMFKQNNFGPSMKKAKTNEHIHDLYKIESGSLKQTYWADRKPYFDTSKKISIALTKSLTEDAIYVGHENFDVGYMTTAISSSQEVDNIKSFILSEYFIAHCNKWKALDGYGFNNALKYLPPFDTAKSWTSAEVEIFLKSYVV